MPKELVYFVVYKFLSIYLLYRYGLDIVIVFFLICLLVTKIGTLRYSEDGNIF